MFNTTAGNSRKSDCVLFVGTGLISVSGSKNDGRVYSSAL